MSLARHSQTMYRPIRFGVGHFFERRQLHVFDSSKNGNIRDRIVDRGRWAHKGLVRAWYRSLGYAFDWRHGTETNHIVVEEELDGTGPNAPYATRYEPSPSGSVRRIVADSGIATQDFTFVDLGAGKGKAVLDALGLGFGRVIGVEFSPTLHEASLHAERRYRSRTGVRARVDLLRMDAADFEMPGGNLFVYLYHPFEEPVMKRVVENLERAVQADPGRQIAVGYLISTWSRHFEASTFFEAVAAGRYAGYRYHVFRAVAPTAAARSARGTSRA